MMGEGRISRSIRAWSKDLLSPHPRLFLPVYRLLARPKTKSMLIGRQTDIVIEGFPRSANTFAVLAFESSQTVAPSIAHHLHSETQILEGVRRGLPCLVLIRNPEDAIRAMKFAFPRLDETRALRRWLRFYKSVRRVRDRVVIADFGTATKDFGSVIAQVNRKFGTTFNMFRSEDGGPEHVFGLISDVDRNTGGSLGAAGAKPSEEKKRQRELIVLHVDSTALAEARKLYAELTNHGP